MSDQSISPNNHHQGVATAGAAVEGTMLQSSAAADCTTLSTHSISDMQQTNGKSAGAQQRGNGSSTSKTNLQNGAILHGSSNRRRGNADTKAQQSRLISGLVQQAQILKQVSDTHSGAAAAPGAPGRHQILSPSNYNQNPSTISSNLSKAQIMSQKRNRSNN